MEIFLIAPAPPGMQALGYTWATELRLMGHSVTLWPHNCVDERHGGAFMAAAQKADLILSDKAMSSGGALPRNWIEAAKRAGKKTAWFTDDDPQKHTEGMLPGHQVEPYVATALAHDFQFTCCESSVEFWNSRGGNAAYLPMFFHSPHIFHPIDIYAREMIGVVLAGRHYENVPTDPLRARCAAECVRRGLDVRVAGPGRWELVVGRDRHLGLVPWGAPLSLLYNRAKIVVCDVYTAETITSRYWEVPLCKTLMLCRKAQTLDRYLTAGVHMDTWETADECAEKATYYLQNEDERERMAEECFELAMANYTCRQYFATILEALS